MSPGKTLVAASAGLPIAMVLFTLALPAAQEAEDEMEEPLPVLGWQHLTGEWWGLREMLAARGLELELVHTWDLFSVVSGGLHRKLESLGNMDLQLKVDLEKLAGWTGASLQVYGLGDYGGNPSKNAGDAQVHDNIESPDTWKLYEAWFQQEFVSGKLSFLAGLYDLNSEFDVSPPAVLFINSSHGIGADFAQSGLNGPSIFPTTSLAGRIKVSPWDNLYAQVGVLDGVPGDPEDPRGTHVILDSEDGVLVVSEVALLELQEVDLESPVHRIRPGRGTEEIVGEFERATGKLAVGAWVYTAEFDVFGTDSSSGPDQERGNHGVYILGSRNLYREPESWFQGLYAFLRAGYADPRFNPFGFYTGAGVVYMGLVPGRDMDATGLAVAAAYNGGRWSDVLKDGGSDPDVAEVSLEFTYRAQVIDWAVLQGDLQYIFNPGAEGEIEDALVLGLRSEVIF